MRNVKKMLREKKSREILWIVLKTWDGKNAFSVALNSLNALKSTQGDIRHFYAILPWILCSGECFIADITFFLLEVQTDQANKSPVSVNADYRDGGVDYTYKLLQFSTNSVQ